MEPEGVPALVETLFIYGKARLLDTTTKRNLRLCSKYFESLVDATVTAVKAKTDDLNALINTEWHGLKKLTIRGYLPSYSLEELPSALFAKFSRLETLEIHHCNHLTSLPEAIGYLSHLKEFELYRCYSLTSLPSSLGQLTTLEKIALSFCHELTVEGIAPLQHLTGLKSLSLANLTKIKKYPDFICNLTALKELHLYSYSITALPAALGNLTNLETLRINLEKLQKLPESIGNLNALTRIHFNHCSKLTTLPESLDDLLWRKAHEEGESRMERVDFTQSWKIVFSPKMKQALKLLKQNGVEVVVR
jgi:Leucine-rich repeat (LRR) protein